MDKLEALKSEFGLTMLLVEQTRKSRVYDFRRPLDLDDINGSKVKSNCVDAAFGIGRSAKDDRLRYIKQLKTRSSEMLYGADNVAVYELVKENSFLQFRFVGFDTEDNHLREESDDKKKRKQEAVELHKQGKNNVEIAKQLGVSEGAVRKWLKKN
jgi:hypothetical protein